MRKVGCQFWKLNGRKTFGRKLLGRIRERSIEDLGGSMQNAEANRPLMFILYIMATERKLSSNILVLTMKHS